MTLDIRLRATVQSRLSDAGDSDNREIGLSKKYLTDLADRTNEKDKSKSEVL